MAEIGSQAALCNIFNVPEIIAVQDVLNCILLSESVYRAHERGAQAVVEAFNLFQQSFAPGLITVTKIQCSLPHVQHRYVVGVADDAMYVAFMGTKAMRDIISDINYVQAAIWPGLGDVSDVPTAHQGFLARSETVSVELLYAHASEQNKRLVLCGHSLGGAVAQLCTLRLLRDLPKYLIEQGRVKCISFAAPPLGNNALANIVAFKGWSGLFYNLALHEDIVPRLMAMQNSVSLPAAAADVMSADSSGSAAARDTQRLAEQGPPAGLHNRSEFKEVEALESETAPERMHTPDASHTLEGPTEPRVMQGESSPERPPGSPGQAWRSRLRSSLERLRAISADTGPSTSQSMHSAAARPASPPTSQPAVPFREHAPPMGRAQTFATAAARYLPIYMHIGTQHQLHAPPGQAPLRPSSGQHSAEDAETLAALEEQDAAAASAASSQTAASQAGLPEQQSVSGARGYLGLSLPAYRSYMSVLTYHRMFAIRQRAAALCAAAVGHEWLIATRKASQPAELCDDIAPPLDAAAASARVPPSRPQIPAPQLSVPGGQQSSRWPSLQWASTLGALTGLMQPRQMVHGSNQQSPQNSSGVLQLWPWQRHGEDNLQSSSGRPSQPMSASGLPQEEQDLEQQMSMGGGKDHAPGPVPAYARRTWRPWETGGQHSGSSDLNAAVEMKREATALQPPSRQRQWLSWAGASARPDRPPPAQSSRLPLRIIVRGRGLASCTKARVLTAAGAWCPAHVISSLAVAPLNTGAHADSHLSQALETNVAQAAQTRQGTAASLWNLGRRISRRVRDSIVSRPAQQATDDLSESEEELELEAVLPPPMASSVESGLLVQQEGAPVRGLLEVQLRSDFFVRRVGVALQPCTAWALSDSAQGAEMIMAGLCAPPGLAARAEAPPFTTAIAGSVRIVSLWPDTPRAAALSVMAGLVSRRLCATAGMLEGPLRSGDHPQASGDISVRKPLRMEARQQGPALPEHLAPRDEHETAPMLTSRISRPAERAFTRAANAATSVVGAQTGPRLAALTARAREVAGSVRAGFETQLRLLQHGRIWRALKAQPTPQLLILCLKGSPALVGRKQEPGRFFGEVKGSAGSAVSEGTGAEMWEAFSASNARDTDSVRVLLDTAHAAGIPLLVVVMPSSQNAWDKRLPPRPLGLEAASGGTLVLQEGTNELGNNEAWQLKMAVYRALFDAVKLPRIRSKL